MSVIKTQEEKANREGGVMYNVAILEYNISLYSIEMDESEPFHKGRSPNRQVRTYAYLHTSSNEAE